MHLRDADASRDGVLCELVVEAQENDLGLLMAQHAEQRHELGAILGAGVPVIVATTARLLRPFSVLRPRPVERDGVAGDGDLEGLEDQFLVGAQALREIGDRRLPPSEEARSSRACSIRTLSACSRRGGRSAQV